MEKVQGNFKCYGCEKELNYIYCYGKPEEAFKDETTKNTDVKFISKDEYEVTMKCDNCNIICKTIKNK